MSDFARAIGVVIDLHEKGFLSQAKADRIGDSGGATIDGISLRYLREQGIDVDGDGDVDEQDILALVGKPEKIEGIYLQGFWGRLGEIRDQEVATKILDCRVNMGVEWGTRLAQLAAKDLGQDLDVDGDLGPQTRDAINACDPEAWLRAMCGQMEARYRDIAKRKPTLGKACLAGWLDRARWPFREAV